MKKAWKRFIMQVAQYFPKIWKRFIMSVIICFSLVFVLMIANTIMGLFIGLDFYLLLFIILTLGFTVSLTLFDSNKIFYSQNVKQPTKSKTLKSIKKVESYSKSRKKIS